MAATMKDIAERAGVSIGTVDRALNNRGRINPEVAARIRRIAQEMNYRTNSLAKSLSMRGKHQRIAIVFHVQGNTYFDEIERGIHRAELAMQDFGIELAIYRSIPFDVEDQIHQIDCAMNDRATALILVPINDPRIRSKIEEIQKLAIPVVFLTNFLSDVPVFASVHGDYVRSGQIAAGLIRQLLPTGGKVLFLTNPLTMLGHFQRVEAFKKQLRISCPNITECRIVELPVLKSEHYAAAEQALQEYPCDAFVFNGHAQAGLAALEKEARHFPTVFYDLPPITRQALIDCRIDAVIFQNPEQQGYQAVNILIEYITADILPKQTEQLIPCGILIPESLN